MIEQRLGRIISPKQSNYQLNYAPLGKLFRIPISAQILLSNLYINPLVLASLINQTVLITKAS
jgi:hypothetical protein